MPLKAVAGERAGELQYFGAWAALCLAALGAAAALFLLEAGGGAVLASLGGGLVALSPVVWDRLSRGHTSLAAHALLVGIFVAWVRYFRTGGERRPLVAAGGLVAVSAAVHPYLMLMASTLLIAMVAFGARRFGARSLIRTAPPALAALAAAAGVAWVGGFLALPARGLAVSGFGGYELDLLSPVNSAGFARLVPEAFPGDRSREGFAYLGLGVLFLGAIGIAAASIRRWRGSGTRRASADPGRIAGLRELVASALVLAAFATVPYVTIGGIRRVDLTRLLSPLEPLFDVVRANGRLGWPLHLLLALGAILALRRHSARPVLVGALLGTALVLQLADAPAWPWGMSDRERRIPASSARLAAAAPPGGGIRRLALVPAFLKSGSGVHCGDERHAERWIEPALLAARRSWSFNSGHLARAEAGAARSACAASSLEAVLAAPSVDTLYLVSAREARRLERRSRGFHCERLSRTERLCRFVAPAGRPGRRRDPGPAAGP